MYRLIIRICSDVTICLNTNTLFRGLFATEANTKWIFGTSLPDTAKLRGSYVVVSVRGTARSPRTAVWCNCRLTVYPCSWRSPRCQGLRASLLRTLLPYRIAFHPSSHPLLRFVAAWYVLRWIVKCIVFQLLVHFIHASLTCYTLISLFYCFTLSSKPTFSENRILSCLFFSYQSCDWL